MSLFEPYAVASEAPPAGAGTRVRLSFEVFPPKTPDAEAGLWRTICTLAPLDPTFVSVTYGAGGATRDRTHGLVKRIIEETALSPAAHLTCVGASRYEVDAVVRDYWHAGVRHIVALRGDPPAGAGAFAAHPDGYPHATALVAGIAAIAPFEISVACYPEKHPESPSLDFDLDVLKAKADAGAARAISQFFFDADAFLRFAERARRAGVRIPVTPGILPIASLAGAVRMAASCGAALPTPVLQRFEGLQDDPDGQRKVGTEIAIETAERLAREGFVDQHLYILNRSDLALDICHALGLRAPQAREAVQ